MTEGDRSLPQHPLQMLDLMQMDVGEGKGSFRACFLRLKVNRFAAVDTVVIGCGRNLEVRFRDLGGQLRLG